MLWTMALADRITGQRVYQNVTEAIMLVAGDGPNNHRYVFVQLYDFISRLPQGTYRCHQFCYS
jgi:hypothetical protein